MVKNMKMPTVMSPQQHFARVPSAEIERSVFDRSHAHKTTLSAGYLVPIFVDEALPGDTFTLRMSAFVRMQTLVKPIMDNMYIDTFFFAVPIRLVWNNFVKFMGEQANPGDSTSFVVPTFTAHIPAVHSLSDYFGWPVTPQIGTAVSYVSLWHRAYNLIYNEWFRDQNLINSAVVDKDDGPDLIADYPVRRRGKRHDYFTSCLPWPQKGTQVTIPLGTTAPIFAATGADTAIGAISTTLGGVRFLRADATNQRLEFEAGAGGAALQADLSSASAASINSLRQAFQIQKLLERDARGGTRYTEKVFAHFRVKSPDARLQRPEYLGGGTTPIMVSPISQTGPENTTTETPQGNLVGVATGSFVGGRHGFSKSFTEHTLLLGLVSIRADLTYQQGINRMFTRSTLYDFFWPALAHIGEQAVLNREIYADGSANDVAVFGYQERYAEYRYKPSLITGFFRSTDPVSLDVWHLSQEFSPLPTLGQTFIEENPPVSRVTAVDDEPPFLADTWFDLRCARPMPVFGVPGMIDHF